MALVLGWPLLLGQPVIVSGTSMSPSLREGQVVWLDRLAYRNAPPQPGDVVVFEWEGETFVKRVHQNAGAVVHYLSSKDQDWALGPLWPAHVARFEERCRRQGSYDWVRVRTIQVPAGHVFVLGDNKVTSQDSREMGPIPLSAILGRVRMETDRTAIEHVRYFVRKVAPVRHS